MIFRVDALLKYWTRDLSDNRTYDFLHDTLPILNIM